MQPSKNKKFPGYWTFPFRRVNYFIRFTTKGLKVASVKGKRPIITKIVRRKPGKKPKKGGKTSTKKEGKPKTGEKKPSKGKKPKPGKKPATGEKRPTTGKKNPTTGKKTPKKGKKHPKNGKKHPNQGKKHHKKGEKRPITTRPGKPGNGKQLTVNIAFLKTIKFLHIKLTIKQAHMNDVLVTLITVNKPIICGKCTLKTYLWSFLLQIKSIIRKLTSTLIPISS